MPRTSSRLPGVGLGVGVTVVSRWRAPSADAGVMGSQAAIRQVTSRSELSIRFIVVWFAGNRAYSTVKQASGQ